MNEVGHEAESTGRRRPGCLAVAVAVSAGLCVLAMGGWFSFRSRNELPPSRFLSATELVGTWSAAGDGRLILHADGTFEAVGVCGVGSGRGLGSLAGSWEPRPGSYSAYDPDVRTGGVTLTSNDSYELEEGSGDGGAPVLWMYRGVPGDTGICRLYKS